MNSKYVVFALAFILTLSSSSVALASTGVVLAPANVETHGPLVSSVSFVVIPTDSSLEGSLASGGIQAAEWTFTVASYGLLQTMPTTVATGTTTGYTWEGIAFNTLHPYMNNVHYRRAIAYLTDYSAIAATTLSGDVAGLATPYVLPTQLYGFMSAYPETFPYAYNTANAASQLLAAGLYGFNGATQITMGSQATSSTVWCTVNAGSASACTSAAEVFAPTLQWRSDDPLRTSVAAILTSDAALIGLTFTQHGVAGSGGFIYGPSVGAVETPGVYNPSTGYNSVPVFNATDANSSADAWDMYTYGWILSANFEPQAEFWNSQLLGTTANFVDYYNATMDYYSNQVLYATSIPNAESAAAHVQTVEFQNLPYLTSYWENTLWGELVSGWTNYANIPTYGPSTGGGIYYTLLNVAQANDQSGGLLNYAIHQQADQGGMNPLYNTNWVWQADIWASIYDTALATPPPFYTTVNAFMSWMTTGYSVTAFNGAIPKGATYFQTSSKARESINGQVITFNFIKNMTFQDGVPFTAKDYLESLIAWDLAGNYNTPQLLTPDSYLMTGPAGLIAAKVTGTDSISIYVGNPSIWNLADVIVGVMPQHILAYYNLDHISTAVTDADLTQPFAFQSAYTQSTTHPPKWLQYEANTEIGSGPFILTSYSEGGASAGDGTLAAFTGYYRSAWYANMSAETPTSTYTYNFSIGLNIHNPSDSALYCGVSPDSNGMCYMSGHITGMSSVKTSGVVTLNLCTGTENGSPSYSATASATGQSTYTPTTGNPDNCHLLVNSHHKAITYSLTQQTYTAVSSACPTGGVDVSGTCYTGNYLVSIPMSGLSAGKYEVVLETHFTFQGLARTWYQYASFNLS